jgi:hypothetical protein
MHSGSRVVAYYDTPHRGIKRAGRGMRTVLADSTMHQSNECNRRGAMMRILVATDFSEPSLVALEYAMALTYTMSGGGVLVHVIEEEPMRRYAVGREPEPPS